MLENTKSMKTGQEKDNKFNSPLYQWNFTDITSKSMAAAFKIPEEILNQSRCLQFVNESRYMQVSYLLLVWTKKSLLVQFFNHHSIGTKNSFLQSLSYYNTFVNWNNLFLLPMKERIILFLERKSLARSVTALIPTKPCLQCLSGHTLHANCEEL